MTRNLAQFFEFGSSVNWYLVAAIALVAPGAASILQVLVHKSERRSMSWLAVYYVVALPLTGLVIVVQAEKTSVCMCVFVVLLSIGMLLGIGRLASDGPKRIAATASAIACALLCLLGLGATVIWARSYSGVDRIYNIHGRHREILTVADGHFALSMTSDEVFGYTEQGWKWNRWHGSGLVNQESLWRRSVITQSNAHPVSFEFWWGSLPNGTLSGSTSKVVIAPLWSVTLLCGILPAAVFGRALRRWRNRCKAPGLCSGCGYDIRATPARCPECGLEQGPVGQVKTPANP